MSRHFVKPIIYCHSACLMSMLSFFLPVLLIASIIEPIRSEGEKNVVVVLDGSPQQACKECFSLQEFAISPYRTIHKLLLQMTPTF